ncbi:hypothetical protein BJX70DRAFT_357208 [Aspergillus crustosus]
MLPTLLPSHPRISSLSRNISSPLLITTTTTTMSTSTQIPVLFAFVASPRTHEVILIDENTPSFTELATQVYAQLGPHISDDYRPDGQERHITKIWVGWNQSATPDFPRETHFSDSNIRAVLRLLAARRGVDVAYVWLNEIDEPEQEAEVVDEDY